MNINQNENEKGILINQINYKYSITKSERDPNSLIIKLFDPSQKSKFYLTYEASFEQLLKDIKFLSVCEDLDEAIESLEKIFSKGNVEVVEKEGIFNLGLIVEILNKKCFVKLTKNEIEEEKEPQNELEKRIIQLENNYKDLFNKVEEFKQNEDNNIRNLLKEVIFDKSIKAELFKEFEMILVDKYKLNNDNEDKNNKNEKQIEDDIIDKVQAKIRNKEGKIKYEKMNIQKQLKDNINELKIIKLNHNINNIIDNNINYIILQVKINDNDLNKDIKLFQQTSTYKYFSNFERDDIETIIDDRIVPIKYKIRGDFFECKRNLSNCELSQEIDNYLGVNFLFYWNFSTIGMHTLKIIFKKNC